VHRLATRYGLSGWVENTHATVVIEVQGVTGDVEAFVGALRQQSPAAARVESVEVQSLPLRDDDLGFCVRASESTGRAGVGVVTDRAVCAQCRLEVDDPNDRRHRYPFTNCTQCGPRYSIVLATPYDRERTTMAAFEMCDRCRTEYEDPGDRRFHAEPIACPECGPELRLLDLTGEILATGESALEDGVRALKQGLIVGLRGLGGFQLLVDATNDSAVGRLRELKGREEKPFAVMFGNRAQLLVHVDASQAELDLLESAEAPIVLCVGPVDDSSISRQVAPDCDLLGAFLPTTPLHYLLLQRVNTPLVCTSGNLSGEPMCLTFDEARSRLVDVVDRWIDHDRAIARPLDDSVACLSSDGPLMLRRARGYAPAAVGKLAARRPVLALGAHLKNTIALSCGDELLVSQYIGDLDCEDTRGTQRRIVDDLMSLYDVRPEVIACDLHPDYASTHLARALSADWKVPVVPVQHHHAHVAAVRAEHGLTGDTFGLAWDGAGLGIDGTLWGSEGLICSGACFERKHYLQSFPLVGGERAAREPRRVLLGLLWRLGFGVPASAQRQFSRSELEVLDDMLHRDVNCPRCCSIGRLFDAVAALLEVRAVCSYEGQAAMQLEALAHSSGARLDVREAYTLELNSGETSLVPLFEELLSDLHRAVPASTIALRFHAALVKWGAQQLVHNQGLPAVVSGGCFQNRLLLDGLSTEARRHGIELYRPRRLPPNDGQIAAGQAWVANCHEGQTSEVQVAW
jgi:hydrogenase maturation protein HypF